jgi:hypothetical protein
MTAREKTNSTRGRENRNEEEQKRKTREKATWEVLVSLFAK